MADFSISPVSSTEEISESFFDDLTGLSNFEIKSMGDPRAFGKFNDDPFDLKSGIVLSTGKVSDLKGANKEDGGLVLLPDSKSSKSDLSTDFAPVETDKNSGTDGDSITLQISFDSDSTKDKLYFQYVFGSEELLEYGGSEFNDKFSLELNTESLAKLSNGDLVTITSLANIPAARYSNDLIRNSVADGAARNQTRLDGYTVPLTFVGNLQPGRNTLVVNVQDVGDGQYDSAVLLKAKTFGTSPPDGTPPGGTPPGGTPPGGTPPGKPSFEPGNTIKIPGSSTQSANLLFTLKGVDASFINEVGLFKINDDKGGLDLDNDGQSDLFPGDRDYTQAVLEQGKVIFSALPRGGVANATRILDFKGGDRLAFYLVQNSSTDEVLRGITSPAKVFFGSVFGKGAQQLKIEQATPNDPLTLKWEDGTNGGDRDFNDMVLTVQSTDQTPPRGTRLQGTPQGELLDLRGVDLNTDGQVDSVIRGSFSVNSEAANSFVGFYRVDNTDGLVGNLLPGDQGYAAAAIKRSVVNFNRKGANAGQLSGDQLGLLAPYIISNGTPEKFLKQNPNNLPGAGPTAYFNYLGANPDKVDHIRLLSNNTFGFENSSNRRDFDFNDIVVQTRLSPAV